MDVQHKKRGRPRLRDDRDTRFENIRQTHGHPRDMSPRRPVDIHPSGGSGPLDDHYQRHQPFRAVDIATSGGFPAARSNEPVTSSDLNSYHTHLSAITGSSEPVAYLNMSLDFLKGSASFWDILGLPNMAGSNLGDVVLPAELEKVAAIHSYFNNEQRRREPNYLPPIMDRGSQSIHGLGFGTEDFGRFQLSFQDRLVFVGAGRFARPIHISAGLAKEESFYFVVLLLTLDPRQAPRQHMSPGTMFAQRGPGPGPFGPIRVHRAETVDAATVHRGHPSSAESSRPPNLAYHGFDQAGRPQSYHATQDGQLSEDLSHRGILKESSPPKPSHTPLSTFQLPPLWPQFDRTASSGAPTGDVDCGERPKRLAIGGLLGNPDEPYRTHDSGR